MALAIALPFTLFHLPSADIWWDLANGRLLAQTGAIPSQDPFSFNTPGPWQNDEWLSCWLAYLVYQLGGLGALQALKALTVGLTLLVSAGLARFRTQSHGLAALLAGAFCLSLSEYKTFFDIRPYLVTYLGMMLFWGLVGYYVEKEEKRLLWAFPLLTVVWVNLHAGVPLGGVMLGLATIGLLLDREKRHLAKGMGAATVATGVAMTLNIHGWHILTYPFRLLGSVWKDYVIEWLPVVDFATMAIKPGLEVYVGFMAATAIAILANLKKLRPHELLILGAFGFLALTGWRHTVYFTFLAILPWTLVFQRPLRSLKEFGPRAWVGLGVVALLFIGYKFTSTDLGKLSLETRLFPIWGVEFAQANRLPARCYNFYGWGGYMLWRLHPDYQVFIDGRSTQCYREETFVDYLKIAFGREGYQGLIESYDVKTAWVRQGAPKECGRELFDKLPDWVAVYEDDLTVIFVKRHPETEELLSRFEAGELVFPPSPFRLHQQAQQAMSQQNFAQAYTLLNSALRLDEDHPPSLFLLGTLYLQTGRGEEGVKHLERALELNPYLANAHLNLAIYFTSTDKERARRELKAELQVNPSNEVARKRLEDL